MARKKRGHPWRNGGVRGGSGAAGSVREGERGRGAWPGGPTRPAWLLGAKKARWAGWQLGRLGRKLKEIPFRIKNLIFEYTKALEICTRRFRRNFDMRIFPKFF
jgi:hypothetical protein